MGELKTLVICRIEIFLETLSVNWANRKKENPVWAYFIGLFNNLLYIIFFIFKAVGSLEFAIIDSSFENLIVYNIQFLFHF